MLYLYQQDGAMLLFGVLPSKSCFGQKRIHYIYVINNVLLDSYCLNSLIDNYCNMRSGCKLIQEGNTAEIVIQKETFFNASGFLRLG